MIAYEGNEPYVFISYAHKDKDLVMPIVQGLQNLDFRVWYDGGIEVGNEWPDFIAEHLEKCCVMVAFVSRNFGESNNCREELGFAKELEKTILVIYLEDRKKLRAGVRMRLSTLHSMNLSDYPNNGAILEELAKAKALKPCLGKAAEPAKAAGSDQKKAKTETHAPADQQPALFTSSAKGTLLKTPKEAAPAPTASKPNLEELYRQAEAYRLKAEYTAAFSLYKKAAEQGYAPAQYAVGLFYELGKCGKPNEAQALNWYRKAADQGYSGAELKLLVMQYAGRNKRT